MLESVDLTPSLGKKDYKARLPTLQMRLYELQRLCRDGGVGSVVVVEGWETSGKGALIRKMTERLEPRGYEVHYTREARSVDAQMPWLWRFWRQLPAWGGMAIYDQSWYSRLIRARVEYGADRDAWRRGVEDVVDFERMLADDRYVVIKLFLHLERDDVVRRVEALADDPHDSWRVGAKTRRVVDAWTRYAVVVSETLTATDTTPAPWNLVAATDKRWARVRAMEAVARGLESALERRGLPTSRSTNLEAAR